ncbi:MAG: serine hydroxymethyltransferase, partial [Pseudomonadota bacterium]
AEKGVPVFSTDHGFTKSHQFALRAAPFGGGTAASKRLYEAGFLTCGIGLPIEAVENDMNGVRLGTPEIVRWGVTAAHAELLAELIAEGLTADPAAVAPRTRELRSLFCQLHYIS